MELLLNSNSIENIVLKLSLDRMKATSEHVIKFHNNNYFSIRKIFSVFDNMFFQFENQISRDKIKLKMKKKSHLNDNYYFRYLNKFYALTSKLKSEF